MSQVGAVPHDAGGFAQNQLDDAGILAGLLRQVPCFGARVDRGEHRVAAFGLGNDFLRDHEGVACTQRDFRPVEGLDDERGEVVVRLDERDAGKGRYLEPAGRHVAGSPVMRMPA